MEQIELRAQTRTVFGKKTKRLRESGIVPATLYGPRTEPMSLQVPARDLRAVLSSAGTNRLINLWVDDGDKPRLTLAREVQRDVTTQAMLHVDLYEVVMTERITGEVPLTLVGVAPVVGRKEGLLVRGLDSLQVHCLPDRLGDAIEVDLSILERTDQAILVRDLVVDEDIEILTNADEVVVQVLLVREEILVVEEEVEPGEVEVITEARGIDQEPQRVVEKAEPVDAEEQQAEAD
ncbi:MAG: 50S ribosomal protein L25 [Anaerolineae bacterium]